MSDTPGPVDSPQPRDTRNVGEYRVGSWYSVHGHDWQLRSPLTENDYSHATPDGDPTSAADPTSAGDTTTGGHTGTGGHSVSDCQSSPAHQTHPDGQSRSDSASTSSQQGGSDQHPGHQTGPTSDQDTTTAAQNTPNHASPDPDATPPVIHYLLADIEYGALDEPIHDTGLLATFAFLLRNHLRTQAQQRARATGHIAPTINIMVGKSYTEITAESPHPRDLAHVWEDLANALNNPHILYHSGETTMGGQASQLVHATQLMSAALLHRADVYAGTLWHNDLTLRTGPNGAALAPLDISHFAHRAHPILTRIAHTLNPTTGATRHAFWATDASLIGAGFTQPPAPMSADDVLADSHTSAHPHGGVLDTDDAQALMSAAFPLTLTGIMALDLLAQIVSQLLWDITGDRAQLRADRYTYGDQMIVALAAAGDWTAEDARILIRVLLGLPVHGEETLSAPVYTHDPLPDHRIADFITHHTFDGHCERLLYMRRAEREDITPQKIRDHLEHAIRTLHLPSTLAREEVATMYPPLLDTYLTLDYYGSGKGKALPPPLDIDDLERSYYEPTGQHFTSRWKSTPGEAHYLAPHRLSISNDLVVTEWYADTTPNSPLVRRIALAWKHIIAWVTIGEAIALMDKAGRVIFLVPTLYDQVGPLYDLLRTHEATLRSAGIPILTGGERELREHVRKAVAHMNTTPHTRTNTHPHPGGEVGHTDGERPDSAPRSDDGPKPDATQSTPTGNAPGEIITRSHTPTPQGNTQSPAKLPTNRRRADRNRNIPSNGGLSEERVLNKRHYFGLFFVIVYVVLRLVGWFGG